MVRSHMSNPIYNFNPMRYLPQAPNGVRMPQFNPSEWQIPQPQYYLQPQPLTVDQYRARQHQQNPIQDPVNWFRNPSQVIMSNFVYPLADSIIKFRGK